MRVGINPVAFLIAIAVGILTAIRVRAVNGTVASGVSSYAPCLALVVPIFRSGHDFVCRTIPVEYGACRVADIVGVPPFPQVGGTAAGAAGEDRWRDAGGCRERKYRAEFHGSPAGARPEPNR